MRPGELDQLRRESDTPPSESSAIGPARAPDGAQIPAQRAVRRHLRGLPVRPGSCRAVYCSHVLEHLSLEDFQTALRNTFGYLKPGGTFRFVLPDLEVLAREYLASLESDPEASLRFMENSYLGYHKRSRGLSGLARTWLGNSLHLWMWDFKSLSLYLGRAGFTDIRRAKFGDSADPAFATVESPGRWENNLGIECRRPD